MRGELARPTGSTEIGLYGAKRLGNGFGALLYLYFATPSDTEGTAFVEEAGAGAGGAWLCGSWAAAVNAGVIVIVAAIAVASSGRTNVFIMVLGIPSLWNPFGWIKCFSN